MSRSNRKRFADMTLAELEAYDQTDSYQRGRADAFDHGEPSTVLEYWGREEPNDAELRLIVKNILQKMPG